MEYSFWELLTGSKRIAMGALTPKCDRCRTRTQLAGGPQLYLLPVYQDKDYTPSAEYYAKVCRPISQVTDIPVGRRACRMWPLVCPTCGVKAVLVVDFLLVRGQEVPEKTTVCDYMPLEKLLSGERTEGGQDGPAAQSFGYKESSGQGRL